MTAAAGRRIVLISGNSLCNNPRVVKEAATLSGAGYDVIVLGAWLAPDLKARDLYILKTAPFRFVPAFDCTCPGIFGAAAHMLRRARSKTANMLNALIGWQSPHQLGPIAAGLLSHAGGLKADLFIAHSEPSLYVAQRLMRVGRRVGVDMEDWFSEDLLPEARAQRPVRLLRRLERDLLATGAHATCPSRAMSEALAAAYGCKPPTVVYNAFPLAERQSIDGLRPDRRDASVGSIFWYSQTLGPGRGLEELVAALPLLDRDAELHLRGRAAPGMQEWLRARMPERWQQRVFFHPQVTNEELLSRIAQHDIGFAGEMTYCRSRDLTVTNKILHYLLGGLAVVASDTMGQCEVAMQAPGAVVLYESGNPQALAKALNALLNSPENLARAKTAALRAAETTFSWERQAAVLLDAVAAALALRLVSEPDPCDAA